MAYLIILKYSIIEIYLKNVVRKIKLYNGMIIIINIKYLKKMYLLFFDLIENCELKLAA